MTTTANLSVGIDTTPALTSLKALRAEMSGAGLNILVNFDSKTIDEEISRYFKQRKFSVGMSNTSLQNLGKDIQGYVTSAIDGAFDKSSRTLGWNQAALRGGMNSVFNEVFKDNERRLHWNRDRLRADLTEAIQSATHLEHRVGINSLALTSQVQAAVNAGMIGTTLRAAGAVASLGVAGAPGEGGVSPKLAEGIKNMLTPAIDELSKAAMALAAVAKKTGLVRDAGSGTASIGNSFKDPVLGTIKTSVPTDFVTASSQIMVGNDQKAVFARKNFENSTNLRELGKDTAAQSAGDALKAVEEYKLGLKARKEAFALAEKQMAAQSVGDALKASEEYKLGLKARKDAFALAEKQMAAQSLGDALKAGEEYRLGLKARKDALALADKQMAAQSLGDAANAQGQYQSALAARRAALTTAEREHIAALRNAGASAATVARRDGFTNEGVRVSAAKAMINLDPVLGAKLTGNDEILRMIPQLDNLRKAHVEVKTGVDASKEAHRQLNAVMSESHSAARGLAGSMGAMWATYGSVVPLVAAASLGAAIRQIITSGKELEYQLTFVSALSDNTVVSVQRLGQALAGSMVGPVEAAKAMRGLAQNGLDVNQAFMALPSILALATAGEMSLTDAALGATGVMAAFKKDVSDLGMIADVFAKAAAMSNTDVKGMVEAMKQASTVGDQYGVTIEETAAALATMAKRNIEGTAAGTAFRNMMKEMASPTKAAKQAIEDLGLNFFDANHKLLPLQENLIQLKVRLSTLNEESRLAFIERIFGERGGKSANAILSDLNAFGETFDEIKNKSKGFAQGVVDALASTTDGRFKVLMSEFKTEASLAFDSANGGINNFIENLRILVRGDDFQSWLSSILAGVTRLSTFLIENGKAVVTLIEVWAGLKVLGFVTVMLGTLTSAYVKNEAAMIANATAAKLSAASTATAGAATQAAIAPTWGLAAASKGLMAALTGGLSLVIGLGVEFLLLSRSTDQATEAERAHDAAMKNGNDVLDQRIGKMRSELDLIDQKNILLHQGKTDSEADRIIAEGGRKKQTLDADTNINNATSRVNTAQENYQDIRNQQGSADEVSNMRLAMQQSAAKKELDSAKESLETAKAQKIKIIRSNGLEEMIAMGVQEKSRINAIRDGNKRVAELEERGINVPASLKLSASLVDGRVTSSQFKALVEQQAAELNKLKENRVLPTNASSGAPKHALDQAEKSGLISQLNAEEKEINQYNRFRKQLDDARYNPKLYGDAAVAAVAEQRQLTETSQLMALQVQQIEKLKAARDALPGKYSKVTEKDALAAETKKYDTKIAEVNEAFKRSKAELANEKEVQAIKEENRGREGEAAFNKTNNKLKAGNEGDLDKLRESYSTKIESPADAKGNEAARAAEGKWSSAILAQQEQINLLEESRDTLILRRSELLERNGGLLSNEVNALEAALEGNAKNLTKEQDRLVVQEAMAKAAGSSARQVGISEFEKSQTAEYGMSKFWEKYKSEAESSAKTVEDIMKKSTDGMSQSFGNFVATGKGGFKSLITSILSDLARAQANKLFAQLIGFAGNALAGFLDKTDFFGTKGYTLDRGGSSTNNTGDSLPTKGGAAGGTNFVERDMLTIIHQGEAIVPKAFNPSAGGALPQANVPQPEQRQAQVQAAQAPVINMPVTVVNNSGTPVKARTERDSNGGMRVVLDAVRNQLGGEIDNGGGLAHNIQSRFALNNGAGLMR